jgi:hypothetical protein
MIKHRWIVIAVIAALPVSVAADVIKLPGGEAEVVAASDGPRRGMAKAQVEQRYGAPVHQQAAIGEPPISRWDYPRYSVYFEHDRVLHAVAHQP